ncbi:MAG: CAP domain-containing protein [Candidatus Omnitrophota bacterium]
MANPKFKNGLSFFKCFLFIQAILGLFVLLHWAKPQESAPPSQSFISELEKQILDATNQERTKHGLNPLSDEPGLANTARFHSEDMAKRHYFNHIDPDKKDPFYRIARIHRRFIGTGGENILMITKNSPDASVLAKQIVDNWMTSPGHRENILNNNYTVLGVGCAEAQRQRKQSNQSFPIVYATQVFGNLAGYLEKDFPSALARNQQESISVTCKDPGFNPPLMGKIVPVAKKKGTSFELSVMGNDRTTSGGRIRVPGRAGTYQLIFYFPLKKDRRTMAVVPGPIFTVK